MVDLYKGSRSDEWETPPGIIQRLKESVGINFDIAARSSNAKCPSFFDADFLDALIEPWPLDKVCFLNPPFSRAKDFAEKTSIEAARGVKIAMIYKATNLETAAWQDHIFQSATAICFLKGRTNYLTEGKPRAGGCPFGSALVFFNIPFAAAKRTKIVGFWVKP